MRTVTIADLTALLARHEQAALHLADQIRIGEPESIAFGRAVQIDVLLAWNAGHRLRPRLLGPSSSRRCRSEWCPEVRSP